MIKDKRGEQEKEFSFSQEWQQGMLRAQQFLEFI